MFEGSLYKLKPRGASINSQWLQPAIVLAIQWAMRRFLITSQQSLNSAASSPLFAASVLRNTAKQ
jgi:hypothetical protein